jgi:hypothetical protein
MKNLAIVLGLFVLVFDGYSYAEQSEKTVVAEPTKIDVYRSPTCS